MNDILSTTTVHKVNIQFIDKIIDSCDSCGKYDPLGLYYAYDEKADVYVGCDNSSGDAWVEEFVSESECILWLMDCN